MKKKSHVSFIMAILLMILSTTNVFASSYTFDIEKNPTECKESFNDLSIRQQITESDEVYLNEQQTENSVRGNGGDLDDLDIAISAAIKLNSEIDEEDILKSRSTIEDIIPLYENRNTKIAYYIKFNPTGYAIVNNNPKNPELIEFGSGRNEQLELMFQESNTIKYSLPIQTDESNEAIGTDSVSTSIYDYYPDLLEDNQELVQEINLVKADIRNSITLNGKGGYGFYDWGSMPGGSYKSNTIKSAGSTDWITTSEVKDIAKNHCGATAVTNIALYYHNRGYSNLKISGSKRETFKRVHSIIGNGPVMTIAGGTKTYFSNRGYNLSYSNVGNFATIKNAVTNDRVTGILLANGIVDWHWVLGVGYREYANGGNYIRIVNGWNNTINKFYKPHSGSLWVSATQYWVR